MMMLRNFSRKAFLCRARRMTSSVAGIKDFDETDAQIMPVKSEFEVM
jgi:hypothetical protein